MTNYEAPEMDYSKLTEGALIYCVPTKETGIIVGRTAIGDVRIKLTSGPDNGEVIELLAVEVISYWRRNGYPEA